MVLADIAAGTFKTNTEIARDVARKHPYKQWLGRSRRLETLGASKGFLKAPLMTAADALKLQASSGALPHVILPLHPVPRACRRDLCPTAGCSGPLSNVHVLRAVRVSRN